MLPERLDNTAGFAYIRLKKPKEMRR